MRRHSLTPGRPAHAVCVWCRDWPHRGRWAWSCACGAARRQDLPTLDAAREAANAHMATARTGAEARR